MEAYTSQEQTLRLADSRAESTNSSWGSLGMISHRICSYFYCLVPGPMYSIYWRPSPRRSVPSLESVISKPMPQSYCQEAIHSTVPSGWQLLGHAVCGKTSRSYPHVPTTKPPSPTLGPKGCYTRLHVSRSSPLWALGVMALAAGKIGKLPLGM